MGVPASVRAWMSRLNELGDCFLVTFTAGTQQSRMLIDCGSFRNSSASVKQLDKVTGAIVKDLGGAPLNVVVGTHQHNDHVSGFVHCEKTFRKMNIEQVWLSWLDNPADRRARVIGTAHNNLLVALQSARANLRAALSGPMGARPLASRSLE